MNARIFQTLETLQKTLEKIAKDTQEKTRLQLLNEQLEATQECQEWSTSFEKEIHDLVMKDSLSLDIFDFALSCTQFEDTPPEHVLELIIVQLSLLRLQSRCC